MARFYYSQHLKADPRDKRLAELLSELDDSQAIFVASRGDRAEDFIVVRPDGIHYIRHIQSPVDLQAGPRFGPWELINGDKIPNPHAELQQAAHRLAGRIRESVTQIIDEADPNCPRAQEFRTDIKVFPILAFLPCAPDAEIERPGWGQIYRTLGRVKEYLRHPMVWQHDRAKITLKISRMEVERMARLLGFVQRGSDDQTATTSQPRRIPDNYEFAREVSGKQFYGRAAELTELQDMIRSGKHVAVFGLQRVGKTSLVKEAFARSYPSSDKRPLFIEINLHRLSIEPSKPSEFLEDFLEAAVFATTSALSETASPLALLQRETVEYLKANQRPQHLAVALHKFLKELRNKIGKSITIFVDELQVLGESSKDVDSTKLFRSFVRALGDTAKDEPIQFLFAGRFNVLQFNEVFDWQLMKLCKKIELGFLDELSARDLVLSPSKGLLAWDETAIKEMLSITGGHPYFLQYICSSLVSYANNKNANRIMREDVAAIADEMIQSKIEQNTIRLLYSDFERSGMAVHDLLERIAKSDRDDVPGADLLPPATLGTEREREAKSLLDDLVRTGLLSRAGANGSATYRLRVSLIKRYFSHAATLPVGPEAMADPRKVADRLESLLGTAVIETLKRAFGDGEAGWWVRGVPQKIRLRIAESREKDPERLPPESYFYIIEFKEVIEANWDLFKPTLAENHNRSAKENLDWVRRFNDIRNAVAHPTRSKLRGGLTDEEADFLRERLKWLEAKLG